MSHRNCDNSRTTVVIHEANRRLFEYTQGSRHGLVDNVARRMAGDRTVMAGPVVRLMLADGHDAIRRGVRHLFEKKDNYVVVAEARDGVEALRLAAQLKPDIAIIAYMLPSLNGLELHYSMQRLGLKTEMLIYTMYDSQDVLSSALEAGVRSLVLKSEPESTLIDAVDALSAGKPYFSPTVSDALLTSFLEIEPRAVVGGLTQRECQIVHMIVEGWTNKRIADQLDVTVKTIEVHRRRAMHKLKVRTPAQLVRWAIKNELVQA